MSSFNRIQRQYNWVCKNIKGPLYRIKMRELYIEGKKTFALIKKEAMDRYIANNNTVTRLKPSDKIS